MDEYYSPYFNPNWQPTYSMSQGNLNQGQNPFGQLNVTRPIAPKQFQSINGMGAKVPQMDFSGTAAPTTAAPSGGVSAAGVANAGLAALDVGLSAYHMADEAKAIQTRAPGAEYDAYGNPVYNLGEYNSYKNRIKPRGANAGEYASNIGKAAAAGAAFGGVGAAVGAAYGALSTWLGGRRRKRKMEEAKRRAARSLAGKQKNYNEATLAANQHRAAVQSYYDQINSTNRMMNLYGNTQ